MPKRSCRPNVSEWRHLETVAKVRGILSHKDFLGLEYKLHTFPKPRQDPSIKLRRSIAKSAAFCSFVPLQRKTQCLRQTKVAKVLWHRKNSALPNAPRQSLRIPLWHLKSHTLPKAPSQSPEKKCRFQRREPAYSPRIRLAPNSGAFAQGC